VFTCARLVDQSVTCWGRDQEGELGDGLDVDRVTPGAVLGITNAVSLAASDLVGCAILASGKSMCWGYNGLGAIGDGTTDDAHSPSTVLFP
jgi:alpha-tubulin suppressor-like RCC1 family protein